MFEALGRSDFEHLPSFPDGLDSNAAEEFFARAEESTRIASYVWQLPAGPIHWSEQMFRLLGMDPERDEADVDLFLASVHPDDVRKMPLVIDEVRRGTRMSGTENYRLCRRDGAVLEVISRWVVTGGEDGAPQYLYGTLLDVTDALRENDRLTRALDELARAQRLANVGSWHWDLVTTRLSWSAQLYRILGYERSVPPTPEAWFARVHPDDAEHREAGTQCVQPAGGGPAPPREFRIVRPDGEVRWVFLDAETSFDASGRATEIRGVVLDVTERRRLEERLRESLRMEVVGRLASGVAHDFNNLLTILQSNIDRLRRDPDAHCLDNMETAVRTASDLTQRLLAFSRQTVLRPRVLDLNRTISEVLQLLQSTVPPNIRIDFTPGADIPAVRLDESQVHQVLINLFTNARDAMSQGGSMNIETGQLQIGATVERGNPTLPPGAYCSLTVRDSGSGMTPAIRERAFEPFFTTKPPGQGTGLGLATVFGIVTQSGGHIDVESEPDQGSCFRLYFPAVEEEVAAETTASAALPSHPVRVLLVEDNELIREPLTFLLRDAGYDVRVAGDAAEARKLWDAEERRFDVLMTDIVMPGESGAALARELRRQCPDLRVLFMTGYVDASAPRPDERTEILQKPFRLSVPLDALQRLMARA